MLVDLAIDQNMNDYGFDKLAQTKDY